MTDGRCDVFVVVEAEDRTALRRYSDVLEPEQGVSSTTSCSLTATTTEALTSGILTRNGHEITGINSHVDDADNQGLIFSRDCAEYSITTPAGDTVLVMVNHLKSKGFGTQANSNAKRLRQTIRIRAVYDQRRAAGVDHIAIVGVFNDTPDSAPLAPLLGQGSDLKDVSVH